MSSSEDMVERVARALFINAWGQPKDWLSEEDEMEGIFRPEARIVIKAMREPTPAMVEAGGGEYCNTERWDDQSYEPPVIWRDMIDAALGKPS